MEMNHFCLDVFQRITIPDFLDFMRSVFPFLYAIDTDNATIADLHDMDRAYFVMHEHVVSHRFPNLVGCFGKSIGDKLATIALVENESIQSNHFQTPAVENPKGLIKPTSIPAAAAAGTVLEIKITLNNDGEEDWYSYGTHPVFLCYHWQNTDGSYLVYDGIRTTLKNRVILAGESVKEVIQVAVPKQKGAFKLILTMVQEGVCWFEDMGFKSQNTLLNIY